MAGSGCEIPRKGHIRDPSLCRWQALNRQTKEVAMRSILKSRLGRASMMIVLAGVVAAGVGGVAQAGTFVSHVAHAGQAQNGGFHGGGHWDHHWDHAGYRGGYWGHPYYGPGYYAPPVVYPAPYYGPPGLNLNIPLG
jgi:hypothetical protein